MWYMNKVHYYQYYYYYIDCSSMDRHESRNGELRLQLRLESPFRHTQRPET